MSKILVLNQYYPPDTSATAAMAREVVGALARHHDDVTVIAGRPSYDPSERYAWRPLRREFGRVTVERVGSFAFDRRRMAGRAANYLSYLALALVRAAMHRPDKIVAMTDPPLIVVVAALVGRLRGVPFIYNVRDLHPDWGLAAGVVEPGPLVRLWQRIHTWALHRASRVIVLGDDMRDHILAKGVQAARVVVVRDGAEVPDSPPTGWGPIAPTVRQRARFVVMHAGNLGLSGAWETLARAAGALAEDGVDFVMVGAGAGEPGARAAFDGRPNVRFLPYQPVAAVPSLLAAADLQVVTIKSGLEGLVVPSKLYGILAAGRPVLVVAPRGSDAARIVAERRAGWVADPDDPESVVAAVRAAVTEPEELERRAANAFAAAADYRREDLLREFVRQVERG